MTFYTVINGVEYPDVEVEDFGVGYNTYYDGEYDIKYKPKIKVENEVNTTALLYSGEKYKYLCSPSQGVVKCKCGSYFHSDYVYKRGENVGKVLDSYLNAHNKEHKHQNYLTKLKNIELKKISKNN